LGRVAAASAGAGCQREDETKMDAGHMDAGHAERSYASESELGQVTAWRESTQFRALFPHRLRIDALRSLVSNGVWQHAVEQLSGLLAAT
jgi:hypothetical protein